MMHIKIQGITKWIQVSFNILLLTFDRSDPSALEYIDIG